MLRLLIGTGILLMALGFGAAGWQYWQGLRAGDDAATAAEVPAGGPDRQDWLISATGTPVPRQDVQAYLDQDRFVRGRTVTVRRSARLEDLLAEGEKLPEVPYLQVLADIRAPRVAEPLCATLAERLAEACAINTARVVAGSVDPVLGTADFQIELVYRLKPEAEELPDLAAHVLEIAVVTPDLAGADVSSADAALAAAADAALAACGGEGIGLNCRVIDLTLDWHPGSVPTAQARIAWLSPLPEGMFTAPPLSLPSEG